VVEALFDEPPPAGGAPLADVLARVEREVVPNAAWLHAPTHMAHQLSCPLPAAVWAEPLVAALNQSLAVAELSPAATAIERRVLRWLADLAGLPDSAGGTFTIGAQEGTYTALAAARARLWPDAWEHGVGGRRAVVLASGMAHYSVQRAVGGLGLGTAACVPVGVDARYAMDPAALEAALDAQDDPVLAVVATAGSTPVGAFDDLEAIGRLCAERGVWLHVDGAHGASALLSEAHRGRLAGVGRADSLVWDPHKMLGLPLASGALLVRDERLLDAAFAQRAEYLFHDRSERVYDQGVRSFQCSRRGDALKLWVAWQRHGTAGLAALYDHLCATTTALHDAAAANPDFEPLHRPEANILCFAHRGGRDEELRTDWNASGRGHLSLTRLDGRAVLRATVMNPFTTPADCEATVAGLAELAG
jgi:L-2,4-diaminobutyrate decarboxylase